MKINKKKKLIIIASFVFLFSFDLCFAQNNSWYDAIVNFFNIRSSRENFNNIFFSYSKGSNSTQKETGAVIPQTTHPTNSTLSNLIQNASLNKEIVVPTNKPYKTEFPNLNQGVNGSSEPEVNPYLRQEVSTVQLSQMPANTVSAYFGTTNPTRAEVLQFQQDQAKAFQDKYKTPLLIDGVIGEQTKKALNDYYNNIIQKPQAQQQDPLSQAQQSGATTPTLVDLKDCKTSNVNGNGDNILGCGLASTFGHTTTGGKDTSPDDGNTFCNTKGEDKYYTFKRGRSAQENLKVCVAALRMNDISKIFKIGNSRAALGANRSKWCFKKIKVKNLETGKEVDVQLTDIMSNNNKVIDLSGCAMKALGGQGSEPTLKSVQITWSKDEQSSPQVAEKK